MEIPQPQKTTAPLLMRVAAFLLVIISGVLSMISCYAIAKLFGLHTIWQAVALLFGAAGGTIGMGIIAYLTILSMAEWPQKKKGRASKTFAVEAAELEDTNQHVLEKRK